MEKILDQAQRQLRRRGGVPLRTSTALSGGRRDVNERESYREHTRQNKRSLGHFTLQAERCGEYMPVLVTQQTTCSRIYGEAAFVNF
jgi:hypothetical protein